MPESNDDQAKNQRDYKWSLPPERAKTRRELRDIAPTAAAVGAEQSAPASTPDVSRTMRIGEVAERIGLSMRSIRYYEETGLVPPSARTPGGFRLYTEPDVSRLLLIMQMKPLGFSLEEMREVLGALDAIDTLADNEGAAAARGNLTAVLADVEERLVTLREQVVFAEAFADHIAGELGALDAGVDATADSRSAP